MVFKCQEDSFLKEFTSKVISCEEVSNKSIIINSQKTNFNGFEVVLENTILFPEGGGQPSDTGYLNEVKVHHVARKGDIAVHYVDNPFNVGENVIQKIDWYRREDHMQQHSGQHLISAIIEKKYKFKTISWWLGSDVSFIELDTRSNFVWVASLYSCPHECHPPILHFLSGILMGSVFNLSKITLAGTYFLGTFPDISQNTDIIPDDLLVEVENEVNEYIQQARRVNVITYSNGIPEDILQDVKNLPKDHVGDIRLISIEGIDNNMCCGTHVQNLSQLQAIKLLYSKSIHKNKISVHFLCGKRVLQRLDSCLKIEKQLTDLLRNNPSQHPALVSNMIAKVQNVTKNFSTVLKALAIHEANILKNINPSPKYYCLHRDEDEPNFMNIFIREYGKKDVLLFLSTGNLKANGNVVLYGPEDDVQKLGPRIAPLMNGNGAGKGNKYQAKVDRMMNRSKAIEVIKEHFEL